MVVVMTVTDGGGCDKPYVTYIDSLIGKCNRGFILNTPFGKTKPSESKLLALLFIRNMSVTLTTEWRLIFSFFVKKVFGQTERSVQNETSVAFTDQAIDLSNI